NVTIDNAGVVYALSLQDAFGIYGGSGTGDVSITNAGDLTATGGFGGAFGILADGAQVHIGNAGSIDVHAYGNALGIVADGDNVGVENTGSLGAYSVY